MTGATRCRHCTWLIEQPSGLSTWIHEDTGSVYCSRPTWNEPGYGQPETTAEPAPPTATE